MPLQTDNSETREVWGRCGREDFRVGGRWATGRTICGQPRSGSLGLGPHTFAGSKPYTWTAYNKLDCSDLCHLFPLAPGKHWGGHGWQVELKSEPPGMHITWPVSLHGIYWKGYLTHVLSSCEGVTQRLLKCPCYDLFSR